MDSAVDTASRCRIHAQHDATAGLAPTLTLYAALACSHLTLNTIAKQDEGENRSCFCFCSNKLERGKVRELVHD